jgi:DUF1680 family protein
MITANRRNFLKSGFSVCATAALTPRSIAAALFSATDKLESTAPLEPFPLASVRLGDGLFRQETDTNARYLDSLSVDRLLYSFRLTAGLTSTATPYGGWEDPQCELRGHFAGGHYLSAVAFAFAGSHNTDLQKRGDALVSGLASCQKALGNGYLSAFPSGLFQRLARGQEVWAPFYTYHKIMAGLLDMYVETGNEEALQVAEGMAGWVRTYFSGIDDDLRQLMLRTEYGGMNEVLVNLAVLTNKDEYIETARLFEQPSILDPLAARRDDLEGLHANTNVPKIIGAARMYEVTGERRYRDIAEYFLGEVLAARSYVIGNTSLDEHWITPPDQLKGTLRWTNAECCIAYNLMKLDRHLFGWSGDARWMDAYERTLFNARLGTQNEQGLKQYFFPLGAGYWRAYNSPEESFWCCTGTGAEDFAKFADTIYFHRGRDLYVNQFIASTITWKEEDLSVEQRTNFPREQATTLKIVTGRPQLRTIHVRIPSWTTLNSEIKINGRVLETLPEPGSYVALRREWKNGDTISLSLPMEVRQESLAGDESTVAFLYGPLALAADLGPGPIGPGRIVHGHPTTPDSLPAPASLPKAPAAQNARTSAPLSWIQPAAASELRFKATAKDAAYDLKPMYEIRGQRYSVYWQAEKV